MLLQMYIFYGRFNSFSKLFKIDVDVLEILIPKKLFSMTYNNKLFATPDRHRQMKKVINGWLFLLQKLHLPYQ